MCLLCRYAVKSGLHHDHVLVVARCAQVVLFMNRHNVSASVMQDLLDMLHKCIDRRLTVCKPPLLPFARKSLQLPRLLAAWTAHAIATSHALRPQMQLQTVQQCRKVAEELIEADAGGWLVKEFHHDLLTAPLKLHYRDSAQWLRGSMA